MQSKTKNEVVRDHEDSAADALRYWVNSTTATLGANFAVNLLLQAMKQMLEQVADPHQVERIETVITEQLNETYDYVRNKSGKETSDIERLQEMVDETAEEVLPEADVLSYVSPKATKKIIH
jgi:predicted nucleic acid-binding protein